MPTGTAFLSRSSLLLFTSSKHQVIVGVCSFTALWTEMWQPNHLVLTTAGKKKPITKQQSNKQNPNQTKPNKHFLKNPPPQKKPKLI